MIDLFFAQDLTINVKAIVPKTCIVEQVDEDTWRHFCNYPNTITIYTDDIVVYNNIMMNPIDGRVEIYDEGLKRNVIKTKEEVEVYPR